MASKTSPAMEKALALLKKNPSATKDELMELGLSRASAYVAIRKSKELTPAIKKKPKHKVEKRSFGIVPFDEIPDRLRKKPKLDLEGFHMPKDGRYIPGEITWSTRVYVGVCPACVGKVNMFKRVINAKAEYSGICKNCNIRSTISRD